MRKLVSPFVLLLALALFTVKEAHAQTPAPAPPDCVLFINNWTTAQSSSPFSNYFTACQNWTFQYTSVGFTGLTITVQSAPSATPTAPGAFVTYAGTIPVGGGINPNTSTTGAVTKFNNGTVDIPWIRVNLSGLTGTGTVFGVLYGYKTGYSGSGSGGSSITCAATNRILYGSTGACDPLLTWDTTLKTLAVGPSGVADDTFAQFGYTGIANTGSVEIYAKNDNNNFTAALSVQADENNSDMAGLVEAAVFQAKANNTSGNVDIRGMQITTPANASGGTTNNVTGLEIGAGNHAVATTLIGLKVDDATGATNSFSIKTGAGVVNWGDVEQSASVVFASLPTPTNGDSIYCSDCTVTSGIDNTCKNGGTGAFANRINGAWKCSI